MKPTIEHGIPFGSRRQCWDYPYDEMAVGDSFYIPETESIATTVRQRIYTRNKCHPETVFQAKKVWTSERVVGQRGVGQRVWRLK